MARIELQGALIMREGEPELADGAADRSPDGTGLKTASARARNWAALMHRAFGIDVPACAHCGGRLRLIATLHNPAVPEDPRAPRPLPLRAESRPRPTRVWRRRILIGSETAPRGMLRVDSVVRRLIDGGDLSRLACAHSGRLARPARRPLMCSVASALGGPASEKADYVTGTGTPRGAAAAGGG